ncbi:MAG: FecR domain-containing protein [Myxococcota bacterium]
MRASILLPVLLIACQNHPDTQVTTGSPSEAKSSDKVPTADGGVDAAGDVDADAASIARVDALEGDVKLRRAAELKATAVGETLIPRDAIVTGSQSRARLAMPDDSILAVGPKSTVEINAFGRSDSFRTGKIRIAAGQFWLRISELLGAITDVEVETSTVVAGIRGTTLWGDTERDLFCALAGQVEVQKKGGETVELAAGECLSKTKSDTPEKITPKAEQVGLFLDEVHIGEPLEAR